MSAVAVNAREAAIDAKLAELWAEKNAQHAKIDSAKSSLAYKLNIRGEYVGRRRVITQTTDELMELAAEKLNGEMRPWDRDAMTDSIVKIIDARGAIASINLKAKPLEDLYRDENWNRFFLVNNNGGHIHSSMNCSTCRISTSFSWLPELSGLGEADAVAAYGPMLCTVCFPSAPVEWTMGVEKPEDPDKCPGSGSYDRVEGTVNRAGYNSHGRAKCQHCDRFVSMTSTGKFRSHKKES